MYTSHCHNSFVGYSPNSSFFSFQNKITKIWIDRISNQAATLDGIRNLNIPHYIQNQRDNADLKTN